MKTPRTDCDRSRLERFLADRLGAEEAAVLDRHLEACEFCQQALEKLAAEEEWWSVLPNLVSKCVEEKSDSTRFEDAFPHGFLEPTDIPGCLGLLGPYQINGLLGRGGMGIVLRGFDPALSRPLAIKIR
jgi:hypothetical protein